MPFIIRRILARTLGRLMCALDGHHHWFRDLHGGTKVCLRCWREEDL